MHTFYISSIFFFGYVSYVVYDGRSAEGERRVEVIAADICLVRM
jgi:hypothetical protein